MAKTPFTKLGSQDILSAHLNGLQFSINNVEDALNLATTAIVDHALTPVTDMDDPTIRYRIYEGTLRSWLGTPTPVIKRDGVVVNASEYVIQPAYGVVVFNVQQSTLAVITADVTHVNNVSTRLNAIEVETAKITGIDARVNTAQTEVDTVEGRVTVLEASGSSNALTLQPLDPNKQWLTTAKRGANIALQETITNIPMGVNTIDAFPFWVEYEVEVDAIRTITGSTNSATTNMICGIYSNKSLAPDALLSDTNSFLATAPGTYDSLLKAPPLVLKRGLYWVARWANAGISLDGYNSKNVDNKVHINEIVPPSLGTIINASGSMNVLTGVRTATITSLTTLPTTFPAIGPAGTKYLARNQIALQWVRIKRVF